jgi:hypothetical protein
MLPMTAALAEEHLHDLLSAADHSRLNALARRRHPAGWRLAARRARSAVTAWVRAGQLGPQPNYCSCP